MKTSPYYCAILVWLSAAVISGCTPASPPLDTHRIKSALQFSGASASENDKFSPLSAMCFDENGILYTLVQDSGRITAFDKTGIEKISFVRQALSETGQDTIAGIALGSLNDKIFMLDGKSAQVQEWKKTGELVGVASLSHPLSPGDTAFGGTGAFYHSTEGLTGDSLIVAFDTQGDLIEHLGTLSITDTLLAREPSPRRSLAKGDIPAFLENSVLIATANHNRVYAMHRAKPVLKCYENGLLKFERHPDFPELHDIQEAARIRNRLLEQPEIYIPYSYWSDFAADENGNLYVLLALQTRHTIYKLDMHGNLIRKIIGDYGKGHLLALSENRLAIADAAKRLVTVYAMPEG